VKMGNAQAHAALLMKLGTLRAALVDLGAK
jgi:hypothetical protein